MLSISIIYNSMYLIYILFYFLNLKKFYFLHIKFSKGKNTHYAIFILSMPERYFIKSKTLISGVYVQTLSCDRPFCDPMNCSVAQQAPLSVAFPRVLEWLPFPSPGYLQNPGIKPTLPASPALAGRFFTTAPPGKSIALTFPPKQTIVSMPFTD